MRFTLWICERCGTTTSLPRFAPRPRPSAELPYFLKRNEGAGKPNESLTAVRRARTFNDTELLEILAQPDHWPRTGDSWSESETRKMLTMRHISPCTAPAHVFVPCEARSGALSEKPHSASRCPGCYSKSFVYNGSGVLFD